MCATKWRLVLPGDGPEPWSGSGGDGAREGAWNMALDEAVLDSVASCQSPPTLRLYQWWRPAVTIGRFQNIFRTLDYSACAAAGTPVVRRITGGRGILHGGDLTLGLVVPLDALGLTDARIPGVVALYCLLAEGIIKAFDTLGLPCAMGTERRAGADNACQGDCMRAAGQADVISRSAHAKLVGSAIHRRGANVLQQSSIPLAGREQVEGQTVFFHGDSASGGPPTYPTIRPADLVEALTAGFSAALGCAWSREPITALEIERASELVHAKYLTDAWTHRVSGRTSVADSAAGTADDVRRSP